MKKQLKYLAFIPARGGSKRLPGKNLIDFMGKPLIAWTIEAALKSEYIDEVFVSTDNDCIAKVGIQFGAAVPNLRPAHLGGDRTSVVDVLIDFLESQIFTPEYIVVLQPTSPLRTSHHIDEAIDNMKGNDAIISVTPVDKPRAWTNTLPDDSSLTNFLDKALHNRQSQEFDKLFAFNGAIYVCKTDRFLCEKNLILSNKTVAYKMPYETSVDIDSEVDLLIAKGLYIGLSKAVKKLDG